MPLPYNAIEKKVKNQERKSLTHAEKLSKLTKLIESYPTEVKLLESVKIMQNNMKRLEKNLIDSKIESEAMHSKLEIIFSHFEIK